VNLPQAILVDRTSVRGSIVGPIWVVGVQEALIASTCRHIWLKSDCEAAASCTVMVDSIHDETDDDLRAAPEWHVERADARLQDAVRALRS
jgi:hypothetical protein